MGVICSNLESIDRIHWTQVRKGRVTKAVRVLLVDENAAIIELADGSFTVAGRRHTPNGKWAVLSYGFDKFGKSILDGLATMGIISRDDVKVHLNQVKVHSAERERKYAEKSLINACEKLGIPVPKLK